LQYLKKYFIELFIYVIIDTIHSKRDAEPETERGPKLGILIYNKIYVYIESTIV
jgi:hypothetical protein